MRMSREVGRTMTLCHSSICVLRNVQIAQINFVAKIDHVGIAIFQIRG